MASSCRFLVIYFIDDMPQKAIDHDIELMVSDKETLTMLNDIGIGWASDAKYILKLIAACPVLAFCLKKLLLWQNTQ